MMPKRFLFLSIILFLPAVLSAQQLEIKGTGDNLYLEHSVAPKENFYSIGRLFNVSPRDLASYNKISMDKGLSIGQEIKIPLNKDNFTQATVKSAAEALVPLYHTVAAGETLYRLGVNYKNVSLDKIRQWNNLQGDNVNQGSPMLVGFLRVSKTESALASQDFNGVRNATAAAPKPANPKPESRTETKTDPKPEPKPQQQTAVNTPATDNTVPATPTPVVNREGTNEKSGFFRSEFGQGAGSNSARTKSGSAAVFKSTSGWQDGKFYCFNNDAVPGSIIRISASGGSNAIYAKVLDAIPDIKQNEGLTLVLSNAAADALGVTGDKFEARIEYFR